MKKTHYAIRVGERSMVIVKTWAECSALVTGYPGAIYKGFDQEQAALNYLAGPPPTWKKSKPKSQGKKSSWNNRYSCIERKTYRDHFTGELYTNRCVRRRGPTMTGDDYEPSIDDGSVPWLTDQETEENQQLELVIEARRRLQ